MRINQASSTATFIARCLLVAAHDDQRQQLVPAGSVELLERILAAAGSARFSALARRAAWRWLFFHGERLILPGIVLHFLARKRWLERTVVAALHGGSEQVVVLGAGFDLLAWRLHRAWPEVFFCELDHGATQAPKVAALASFSAAENFVPYAVDLAAELPSAALRSVARFDPRRRTCFVVEGLLMYFPERRVVELLRDIGGFTGATVVFSFMEPGRDGRAAFRGRRDAVNLWLRYTREPFAWAIACSRLERFLTGTALRLQSMIGPTELRRSFPAPAGLIDAPLIEGECLACARSLS